MNKFTLALIAGLGTSLAIGLLSYFDATLTNTALLMAPFGATAVLVFGVYDSPLAQPKNVILGHLITSFIGVFFFQFIDVTPMSLAIATGLGVSVMLFTKTTHPPAGANPILIMLSGQSWGFLVTPVLIGAVTIVLVGKMMQKVKHQFDSKS
ncbi:HPP family protein [Shewanella sp. Choline-02u-19]|uniref:HPP family protein n=1 Tax=unclassified Shewanella TaxID=196818 RepID=UPI000C3294B5|nr:MULTISPECIES: HPP family protein [unclassified Shewanella]PKH56038.1 HPP family protein [Shewanella sp. Bg11-22]PKI30627.1 HPP family protein [Shewanella sp. Choline-02u-19]